MRYLDPASVPVVRLISKWAHLPRAENQATIHGYVGQAADILQPGRETLSASLAAKSPRK